MRNQHIGDSLDLAKRRLLEILERIDCPVLIVPLPFEQEFKFDLYARVLKIEPFHQLFGCDTVRFTGRKREDHLQALRKTLQDDSDRCKGLLLDPDSGVCREYRTRSKWISIEEIKKTLEAAGRSVIWLVYHHQGTAGLRYETVLQLLEGTFYYNFGKAAVVIGGNEGKVRDFRSAVEAELNPDLCYPRIAAS